MVAYRKYTLLRSQIMLGRGRPPSRSCRAHLCIALPAPAAAGCLRGGYSQPKRLSLHPIGYFHIDIRVRLRARYLSVAGSRLAFAQLHDWLSFGGAFLRDLFVAVPFFLSFPRAVFNSSIVARHTRHMRAHRRASMHTG